MSRRLSGQAAGLPLPGVRLARPKPLPRSALSGRVRPSGPENMPFENPTSGREIPFYDRCSADIEVNTPSAYLVPQAWREVIERPSWNQVQWHQLPQDETCQARTRRIRSVTSRATPYEGHMFHDARELTTQMETFLLRAGDYVVPLNQPQARCAEQILEPQGHDSFFRWGFFSSILEKKEHFSNGSPNTPICSTTRRRCGTSSLPTDNALRSRAGCAARCSGCCRTLRVGRSDG